jgi:retron-type reverse transcriptase
VRRVYIDKSDGRKRPLGVSALEDKIVQRATVEVVNAIYEADFLGFSYGFRPRRSQHNALDVLYTGLLTKKVNWVLDVDIRSFFDGFSHEWLVKFVEQLYRFRFQVGWLWHRTLLRRSQKARVLWDRMRRLIDRWLPPARTCHPYPLRRMGVIT